MQNIYMKIISPRTWGVGHGSVHYKIYSVYKILISTSLICVRYTIRPEFFDKLIYKHSYCNFPESRKKIQNLFFDLSQTIICLVEKNFFLRFVRVFLRVTLLKMIVLSRLLGKLWNI